MTDNEDWVDLLGRYILPFGFGVVLMAAVNVLVLEWGLRSLYPPQTWSFIRVCVQPKIAAIQEPFTSKLIPAIAITIYSDHKGWTSAAHAKPLKFGILGGLTVGLVEAGGKLIEQGSLNSHVLPPVLMHLLTGGILATTVYRFTSKGLTLRAGLFITLAYLLASLIHLIWNSYIAFLLAGTPPC